MAQLIVAEFPRWNYFSESHLDGEQGKDGFYRQTRIHERSSEFG